MQTGPDEKRAPRAKAAADKDDTQPRTDGACKDGERADCPTRDSRERRKSPRALSKEQFEAIRRGEQPADEPDSEIIADQFTG